MIITIVMKTAW